MPVTYFMLPEKMRTPEIGAYRTYGIAAYSILGAAPILTVRDVSLDGDLVFHMVRAFNKNKLSPLHLMDAINDMLG